MKYAQLISGLLIGTALGGSVVAATGSGSASDERIKEIVRETISEEGKLIIDAVQKFQQGEQKEQSAKASEALQDGTYDDRLFNDENSPFIGPANSKRVVVEFFDYNCPACKMQFKALDELAEKDKEAKIVFKEYPIFGEQSEINSKIGIAVHRADPDKYFPYHKKMMTFEGRADKAAALKFVKEIGLDPKKIEKDAMGDEVGKILTAERQLGGELKIQGTPSMVVGKELVPHALPYDELEKKLNAIE